MNIELLREAYAIIDGIPDNRFNLRDFAKNVDAKPISPSRCGTVACAAGWLAMHPTFKAMGLGLSADGELKYPGFSCAAWSYILGKIFDCGYDEALHLFRPRTYAELDSPKTDKQVWQARVRKYLKKHAK